MQASLYHRTLRVSAVVVAFMLVFDSGMISPVTRQFSSAAYYYVADAITGVTASIPATDTNTRSAELNAWQQSLQEREAAIQARTVPARDFGGTSSNYSVYILSAILFILTVLIVLNYIMDFVRSRKTRYEGQTA
jgi:hypothetical protein